MANESVFDPLLAEIQQEDQQKVCPACGCCVMVWESCGRCKGTGEITAHRGSEAKQFICPDCYMDKGRYVCAGGCSTEKGGH